MENRISSEVKDNGKLIKIKAYHDESKQKQLTVWLFAWTFCGVAIGSQLFVESAKDIHTFIFIFLAFWAYFEYKVVKVFRWRKKGEEQIWITDEQLHYGRTVNNRGFLRPYRKELINPVKLFESEQNTFVKSFLDSYWVIGGETLLFSANGKVIPFGLRLKEKESKKVMTMINKELGT